MSKMFNKLLAVLFVCCLIDSIMTIDENTTGETKILSRKKRYVTFPEGSSFSCAACMTVGVIGQPAPVTTPGTFTFGMNWGIAYELPNATETLSFYRRKYRRPITQRRNRRDLYTKLEAIMDSMGYNGRDCVLKTLCETTQRILPHGENMIEEMFRTLFTLPMTKVLPVEPYEHAIYDAAHRLGVLLDSCDMYRCPISLVDLAKGYYNAPSPRSDLTKSPLAMLSSNFG